MMSVEELIEMASRPHQVEGRRKRFIKLLETKIKKNEKKIELFRYLEEKLTSGSN
jgi:hypothetical protein